METPGQVTAALFVQCQMSRYCCNIEFKFCSGHADFPAAGIRQAASLVIASSKLLVPILLLLVAAAIH